MILKIHKDGFGRAIVAVCDNDLIGKIIEEGKKVLDLSAEFYKGEIKSENEIELSMKIAYSLNIVGKDSIEFAIKIGVIERQNVNTIGGIPYAQSING